MEPYVKNPACSCPRCRAGRLFAPAMIITIGALFLLDQNSYMELDRTWPVILLVAGLFSFLSRSASTEGHVQPYMAMPMAMQVPMQQAGMAPSGMGQAGMPAQPGMNHSSSGEQGPTHSSNSNDDTQVNS
jgi:hypothetical protein